MNRSIPFLLCWVILPLLYGCNIQTRSSLEVQINQLTNDIHMARGRLAEIPNLRDEIEINNKQARVTRVLNKKLIDETPGLREKVKRQLPEAEALKP